MTSGHVSVTSLPLDLRLAGLTGRVLTVQDGSIAPLPLAVAGQVGGQLGGVGHWTGRRVGELSRQEVGVGGGWGRGHIGWRLSSSRHPGVSGHVDRSHGHVGRHQGTGYHWRTRA